MFGEQMKTHLIALFYGGPDQIIPLQTGLAAALAIAVMFWNRLLVFFHRQIARFKPKPEEIVTTDATVQAASEQNSDQP
jgi:hypothetical protein